VENVPLPSADAAYHILGSSLDELKRHNIVVDLETSKSDDVLSLRASRSVNHIGSANILLRRIAERCGFLSGRTLRRLPYIGLALYGADPISNGMKFAWPLDDALRALSLAVDKEIQKGTTGDRS
jgi:hypothetical protein